VRKPAQAKVERTVVKSLSSAADEYAAIEGQVTIYEDKALPGGQLRALPAPKGKYMQNRDQLRRLVMSNPQLSQRDVASQFSISRSTAGEWLKKIKAGN
jgi:hypothetical protein